MTVIKFPPPANDRPRQYPPMFNIPPLTLWVLVAFVAVYAVFAVMPEEMAQIWGYRLAFVPARYALPDGFDIWAVVSPFTHIFMHGGILHIAMNGLMMLAFGAGAERMLGAKRAGAMFILCGLCGAFAQLVFGWGSPIPMVGASGALSGLFAAMCLRLMQTGAMPKGRFGIWGIGALWIGLSVFMAFAGGAMGIGDVAWAAHVGGFLGGVLLMRLRYFS
ncbi:MAG: rhomboid family intramembrane serine protease [Alphaproteobacteria bacterium]|nr:rhomboid family intramembrane serine protease [Alphaproteobacteria bacterium]